MAAPPTVLIIGCGIAGPVLAVLLRRKGYRPIIFEKVRALGDAGASLMLMPNGMKVLSLLGLAAGLAASPPNLPLEALEDRTASGALLGSSALPSAFKDRYGQPAVGVKRTALNLALKQAAADAGVEVREGWALESIEEDRDRQTVTARFANGEVVSGDFLVGCDGNQGGIPRCAAGAAREAVLLGSPANGATAAADIHRPHANIWVLPHARVLPTTRTAGGRRGRRLRDAELVRRRRARGRVPGVARARVVGRHPARGGGPGRIVADLRGRGARGAQARAAGRAGREGVRGARRPLDAIVSEALPDVTTAGKDALGDLESIFAAYARKRQPRTAALVQGARATGEKRVVTTGSRDCELRDQRVAAEWKDLDAVAAKYDNLCREPF